MARQTAKASAPAPAQAQAPAPAPARAQVPAPAPARRGRTALPFDRLTIIVRPHNTLNWTIDNVLDRLSASFRDDGLVVRRTYRGESSDDVATILVAMRESDLPTPSSGPVQRGIRIPQGKLAMLIRALAAKHGISIEEAAEQLAAAFES